VVDTTRYYAHTDAAGNVMALTAGNGSLARTYWYDTWGQLTGGTDYVALNGRDMARFKGALHFQLDGVELHYMRNRLYEPKTGRFLSEDPIGLEGGINLYTFAGNDPVNGRDALGLREGCELWGWYQYEEKNGRRVITRAYDTWWVCPGEGGGTGARGGDGTGLASMGPSCSAQFGSALLSLGIDAAGGWLRALSAARGLAHAAALQRTAGGLFAEARVAFAGGNPAIHGVFAGAGFGTYLAGAAERAASTDALILASAGIVGRAATRDLLGALSALDWHLIGLALPGIGTALRFYDWSSGCL
jgi:RHS repeat-associated protein